MTSISYPDLVQTSERGLRRAEALSPDNGAIPYPPGASEDTFGRRYSQFQSNFRYRLLDEVGTVLWERRQPPREPSPGELCVADDGWVVARLHDNGYAGLRVFDPVGRVVLAIAISSRRRSSGEPETTWTDDHVSDSTAGPFWAHHSLPLFVSSEGRRFFSWRTWWDRRIVIDLEGARLLDGPLPPGLREVIAVAERAQALATLAKAAGDERFARYDEKDADDVRRAQALALNRICACLHIAGMSRLHETADLLRRLEPRSWASGSRGSDAFAARGIWVTASRPLMLVQQALRRLGLAPGPYDAYRFLRTPFVDRATDNDVLPMAPPERDVAERWARLETTMSPEAILLSLGSPSFVTSSSEPRGKRWVWRESWEYDFGLGESAKTRRITWDPDTPGRILETGEFPPAWDGPGRPLLR